MTPDAKVAALVSGAVLDALWQRYGPDGDYDAMGAEYAEWKAVAVAAVEALPVSEPGASGSDEAVDRVRVFLDGLQPNEQILGWWTEDRPLDPVHLRALLATVDRLTDERNAARDLAFRAAFGIEEGAKEEWTVVCADPGCGFVAHEFGGTTEEFARLLLGGGPVGTHHAILARRVISPWKPVSP